MRWSIPKTVPSNTTHFFLEYGYMDVPMQLSAIEADSFVHLPDLLYLDLRHMALSKLKSGSFNGLHKLQILLLGYNYLHLVDSIAEDLFVPVAESLQYLDYTPVPTSRYLANLTNLQSIVINYTRLSTFGPEIKNMSKLNEIIVPKCDAQLMNAMHLKT